MRGSVIGQLILKDWRLQRTLIVFSILGGAIALAITLWRGEAATVVGTVFFYTALILVGHILPLAGILGERKSQNLAFLMSLPVSSIQYTISKLLSTFGMFLIPWLTLVISGALFIEVRGLVPRGTIPTFLILAFMPLVAMCLITGVALVGETEGWALAANVACSSSYWLVWYFLSLTFPALGVNAAGPAPVWSSTVLKILGSEFGLCLLILALTFYFQSRKRDFI